MAVVSIAYTSAVNAAELRTLCLSLPGTTETVQWGDNHVFKVAGKMFAISGPDAQSMYSLKADPLRFLELSDQPGIRPAPYLARHKWIQVDPQTCPLPSADLEMLVRRSYELVFAKLTKKLQREIRPDPDG